MISEIIQGILEQICDSYGPVINSDTLPVAPFCIHEEKVEFPLRTKEGIYGFQYDLSVTIVGDNDSQVDPIMEGVLESLEQLSNNDVDDAWFEGSTGLQYDDEKKKFYNTLNFKVLTNNL